MKISTALATLKSIPSLIYSLIDKNDNIKKELDSHKILKGKILSEINHQKEFSSILANYEFKVFSQWGDDGIIQHLIKNIEIPYKTFVEFGVENYTEANTKFLLINDNWRGLILDGSEKHMKSVIESDLYWKYDLTAKAVFITAENINQLITEQNFENELGILHIDIDGNDYWVWKSITSVNPVIVIVEYNSVFGDNNAWTTPYDSNFARSDAHFSNLYYGSSLLSLCDLAEEKGYNFVGCNSAGNNAYFVRKDKLGKFKPLTSSEGYVCSKFSESRDEKGNLTFLRREKRLASLKGLQVFNTRLNKLESI